METSNLKAFKPNVKRWFRIFSWFLQNGSIVKAPDNLFGYCLTALLIPILSKPKNPPWSNTALSILFWL